MKKVHPSDMVYHLWANQSQEEAYNQARNVSFQGAYAYSYRACIAQIVKHKGKQCVLFANQTWTVTTSGHQSMCRRAIHGMPRFDVEILNPSKTQHKDNLKDYQARIINCALRATRARARKSWIIEELEKLIAQANAYAAFFGLKTRFKTEVDLDELKKLGEEEENKAIRRGKAQQKAREKKEAEAMTKFHEDVELWKKGEKDKYPSYPGSMWPRPDFLDHPILRIRGSRIETSQGAIVEIEEAKTLLPFVRSGKEWHRNGQTIKIGHFELDAIDAEGNVKIGCHSILREEIERIAGLLGLGITQAKQLNQQVDKLQTEETVA